METAGDAGTQDSEIKSADEHPISGQLSRVWQLVDQPSVRHWGTKVGIVVGACLLLFVLYAVVGKRTGDETARNADGQADGQADLARADTPKKPVPVASDKKPAPKRAGSVPAATKLPAGGKPATGKAALPKQNGGPAQPPAAGQPKVPGNQNVAKKGPPGQPVGKAGVPTKPPVNPKQPAGGTTVAGLPPRPDVPGGTTASSPPATAPRNQPQTVARPDTRRDSGFDGGNLAGVHERTAASGPGISPGGQVPSGAATAGRGGQFNDPGGSFPGPRGGTWPRDGGSFAGGSQTTIAGGSYPSTETPSGHYRPPGPRVAAQPFSSSESDRAGIPGRGSSFGSAPPSMDTRYPQTQNPTEDYLRRRIATDAPAYRTSMLDPVPNYADRYDTSSQPGTARLRGTIESSPIRTSYD